MEWIAVSERLPANSLDCRVLVYGRQLKKYPNRYMWEAGACGLHDAKWLRDYEVTHWAELPPPPSK